MINYRSNNITGEYFFTKYHLDDFIERIDLFLQEIFGYKSDIDDLVNGIFSCQEKKIIYLFLKNKGIRKNTHPLMSKSLKELKDYLSKKIETFHLTFSFNPNEKLLRRIYGQIQIEIKDPFVIDVKVDENILGGVIIEYRGKYKDYSLSKKLNYRV